MVKGTSAEAVIAMRNQVLKCFEDAGFAMHNFSETMTSATVYGADLGGRVPHSRRVGAQAWTVRQALEWLASGPTVTGRQVEVLLGHYVATSLCNRSGLAVMRAVYNFIRDNYVLPTPFWASCCYECWIMSSIKMILSADLTRPWSSTVSATNASLSGMGVCQAAAPLDDVSAA
eukprot:13590470-Heterocapsa_arctica.AAC.1